MFQDLRRSYSFFLFQTHTHRHTDTHTLSPCLHTCVHTPPTSRQKYVHHAFEILPFLFCTQYAKQTLNTKNAKFPRDEQWTHTQRKKRAEEKKKKLCAQVFTVHCADNFFCINFVPLSVLRLPFKILISFYFWISLFGCLPLILHKTDSSRQKKWLLRCHILLHAASNIFTIFFHSLRSVCFSQCARFYIIFKMKFTIP